MLELSIFGGRPAEHKRAKTEIHEEEHVSGAQNILKRIFEIISDIVDECEIRVNEKGFSIQVMDSMHSCLADIYLNKTLFDVFRCDRDLSIGIKVKEFLKVLKSFRFEKGFVFTIQCQDEGNDLIIIYEGDSGETRVNLTLYDLSIENFDFPQQNYIVEAQMDTKDFLYITKSVGGFGDHIKIETDEKQLIFKQVGERVHTQFKVKEKEGTIISISGDVQKEISMKYMNPIAKTTALSDSVMISFGSETPVFFEFKMENEGFIRFYIAPKCGEDE